MVGKKKKKKPISGTTGPHLLVEGRGVGLGAEAGEGAHGGELRVGVQGTAVGEAGDELAGVARRVGVVEPGLEAGGHLGPHGLEAHEQREHAQRALKAPVAHRVAARVHEDPAGVDGGDADLRLEACTAVARPDGRQLGGQRGC